MIIIEPHEFYAKTSSIPQGRSVKIKGLPKTNELVIVCGNKGGGYKPLRCLLPHQIYEENLKKWFEEDGFESISIFSVKSSENILVAVKNEYCKKRWKNK